eukprot:scaffold101527_cov63-Phaeocystis_antarctica.AAC.4
MAGAGRVRVRAGSGASLTSLPSASHRSSHRCSAAVAKPTAISRCPAHSHATSRPPRTAPPSTAAEGSSAAGAGSPSLPSHARCNHSAVHWCSSAPPCSLHTHMSPAPVAQVTRRGDDAMGRTICSGSVWPR